MVAVAIEIFEILEKKTALPNKLLDRAIETTDGEPLKSIL